MNNKYNILSVGMNMSFVLVDENVKLTKNANTFEIGSQT